MEPSVSATITQPGQGRILHAFGNTLSVLLDGQSTGGKFAVMSELVPPGGGPPMHVHANEEEVFLVAEGRLSYCVNEQWQEVAPGGVVYLPRGAIHCYRNIGEVPARHWIVTLPSGFENFFAACAEEFARQGGPDSVQIVKIHLNNGIELLGG